MKEKRYSQIIANGIKSFLKEDDWHFSFDEQRGLFEFGLSLKGKLKKINYIVKVKEAESKRIHLKTNLFGTEGADA